MIDVAVYPNGSTAFDNTACVVSLNDEIQRFERGLESARQDGATSGYEVPIKDSMRFPAAANAQQPLRSRRAVAVTR